MRIQRLRTAYRGGHWGAGSVTSCGQTEESLRTVMGEVVQLLDGAAERHWATTIREAQHALDPNQILRWFGGMGSLNDLILSRVNGHNVDREDESRANERLAVLQADMFRLASELLRSDRR